MGLTWWVVLHGTIDDEREALRSLSTLLSFNVREPEQPTNGKSTPTPTGFSED